MGVFIGLDVGSVSVKLAALSTTHDSELFREFSSPSGRFTRTSQEVEERLGSPVVISRYQRTFGTPLEATNELLDEFRGRIPGQQIEGIRVTGSGARLVAEALGMRPENEFKAIACAVGNAIPQVRTVFEIGGESSKFILLTERDKKTDSAHPGSLLSLSDGKTTRKSRCRGIRYIFDDPA